MTSKTDKLGKGCFVRIFANGQVSSLAFLWQAIILVVTRIVSMHLKFKLAGAFLTLLSVKRRYHDFLAIRAYAKSVVVKLECSMSLYDLPS